MDHIASTSRGSRDHQRQHFDVVRRRDAAQLARRYARAQCAGHTPPTLVEDVELVVSELVTNAMRHGRGQITMHLEVAPDRVVVGVQDQGAGRPSPREPTPPT